jgi:two-component system, OmpR family, sensor histidine kinase MprB
VSFRLRLTLLASLAVAVAIVTTSFVVYFTDRSELMGQVDADLSGTQFLPPLAGFAHAKVATQANRVAFNAGLKGIPSRKVILPRSLKAVQVSIGPAGVKLAAGPPHFSTTTIGGVRSRVLSLVLAGRKVEISTSLLEVDRNLDHLRWLLVFISLGGIGAAAILGALVSGRAVAPLRRLTETAERIVRTGDLSQRTGRSGRDEISRLSAQLDELLATLESSLRTQRQLVADASHELRTPIATLRANFELLAEPGVLDAAERAELGADVRDELESMTALVGELVELARGEELDVAPSRFRLDEVVQTAVDRAARRAPALSFRTRLERSVVSGVPERIERAVSNLLDNARKWSPAGGTVDVAVRAGLVEVRDRGPGIAAEDLPLVFNRFYRSPAARGMPGAGLGLAIVKQIADAHGGTITADRAPDGGAILRLELSPIR